MAAYGNPRESEIDQLRNRVKFLEADVSKLRQELKILSTKVESARIPMEVIVADKADKPVLPPVEPEPEPMVKVPEVPPAAPIFFLSTPNADGSFNNSSTTPAYREGASIYKFQNTKEDRAEFSIYERDASVKLALAYPDKNIDPVCDALNAFDPRARKIVTVEPGLAELTGDKWRVITKARIRYES